MKNQIKTLNNLDPKFKEINTPFSALDYESKDLKTNEKTFIRFVNSSVYNKNIQELLSSNEFKNKHKIILVKDSTMSCSAKELLKIHDKLNQIQIIDKQLWSTYFKIKQ